jgi:hypothetical protein
MSPSKKLLGRTKPLKGDVLIQLESSLKDIEKGRIKKAVH